MAASGRAPVRYALSKAARFQRQMESDKEAAMNAFRQWKTIGTIGLTFMMALRAVGDEIRPFRGHVDEVIIDVAPVPEGLLVTATGEGQATHLGQFTRLGRVVLHPEDGSAQGTVVFTAANGDQLFMDV